MHLKSTASTLCKPFFGSLDFFGSFCIKAERTDENHNTFPQPGSSRCFGKPQRVYPYFQPLSGEPIFGQLYFITNSFSSCGFFLFLEQFIKVFKNQFNVL